MSVFIYHGDCAENMLCSILLLKKIRRFPGSCFLCFASGAVMATAWKFDVVSVAEPQVYRSVISVSELIFISDPFVIISNIVWCQVEICKNVFGVVLCPIRRVENSLICTKRNCCTAQSQNRWERAMKPYDRDSNLEMLSRTLGRRGTSAGGMKARTQYI